ncbi:MAG: YaeQ family protein [Burkholderiales bacterium]|jgi:uncharacterized protein YaeQ
MALKSTIFKANLSVADIDHGYYADHNLTLARHPSETDERMMVRLVALGLHAHELQTRCNGDATLAFGAGLSDADDPDVVLTDYTGAKRVWIEVGQPDDKAMSKACSKAESVVVYAFGPAAEVWWKGVETKITRLDRLQVWRLPHAAVQELTAMAERSMQLQATIQEGHVMLSSSKGSVDIEPVRWR